MMFMTNTNSTTSQAAAALAQINNDPTRHHELLNIDTIISADDELSATGQIVFADDSRIVWDMDGWQAV